MKPSMLFTLVLAASFLMLQTASNAQSWQQTSGPEGGQIRPLVPFGEPRNSVQPPNTGSSTGSRSPNGSVNFHRAGIVYTASELAAVPNGSKLFSVGFQILTPASTDATGNIKIYLANTNDANFKRSSTWSALIASPSKMALVYDGPVTIPAAAGFYTITFKAPFNYQGNGLYVAYDYAGSTLSSGSASYVTNDGQDSSIIYATGTIAPTTLNTPSTGLIFRPVLQLGYIDYNDVDTLFAGSSTGVYRSTNRGQDWSLVGLQNQVVYDMIVKGNTIFAGSFNAYRSTDGGGTWQSLSGIDGVPQKFAVGSSGDVFLGTVYGSGVHRSTDDGITWTLANTGLPNSYRNASLDSVPQIRERCMASSITGDTLYAGFQQGGSSTGIYRTINNGASWQPANGSPVAGNELSNNYISGFAVSDAGKFYVSDGGTVYLSTNGGGTWTNLDSPPAYTLAARTVGRNDEIYLGQLDGTVQRSINSGTTWTALTECNMGQSGFFLRGDSEVYVATDGSGVWYSTDKGSSWQIQNRGMRASIVYTMTKKGENLYAGTYHNSLHLSTNDGVTWVRKSNGIPNNARLTSLAVKGSAIFVGDVNGGVFRSTNNGNNWTNIDPGSGTIALAASGGDVFAGTFNGIYRTTNDGDSWTKVGNAASGLTNEWVVALTINGPYIFAGTPSGPGAGVYRSSDRGDSWTLVGSTASGLPAANPNNGYGYVQSVFVVNTNTVYAGVNGAGKTYKSTDNGGSWAEVAGIGESSALAVSGSSLFAAQSYGGVFASTNSGASWEAINTGLFNPAVQDIATAGNNLVAGTNGSGLFTYDLSASIFWQQTTAGPSNTLNGVSASGSSALAIGDGGQVYQSTDGGVSYAASAPAAAGGNNLNGLTTSSSFGLRGTRKGDGTLSTEGFGSAVAVGVGGTILRSGDGGSTWSSVQSSGNTLNDVASTGNLGTARVGKSDGTLSTEGFGSAVAVGIGGTILRSGDGGDNWSAVASGSSATLNGVAVADDFVLRGARKGDGTLSTEGFGSAVAVGVGGTILRSGDGGENWSAASARTASVRMAKGNIAASTNAITSQNLNAASFATQSIVVVTGDGGTILRSTDSGANWSIIGSGTAKNLTSVKMINASDGYIAGEIGTLLKTTDGGLTWNREGSPTTEDLNAIAITGGGTAFSAGTASTVVKTETGTSAIIDDRSGTKPEVFALSQNYPNPFNPATTIRYQLPASGDVKLRIYDLLGREVASLVGERQAAGSYTVQFSARGLSSGVYFYKLSVSGSAGNFVSTKKMTLLK